MSSQLRDYLSSFTADEFEVHLKVMIDDLEFFKRTLKVLKYIIECCFYNTGNIDTTLMNSEIDNSMIMKKSFVFISTHYIYDICSQVFQEIEYFKNNNDKYYHLKKTSSNNKYQLQIRTSKIHSDLLYEFWPKHKQSIFNKKNLLPLKSKFRNLTEEINLLYRECNETFKQYLQHIKQFGFQLELRSYLHYNQCLYNKDTSNIFINTINNDLTMIDLDDFIKKFDLNTKTLTDKHSKLKERSFSVTLKKSLNNAVLTFMETSQNPYYIIDLNSFLSTSKDALNYFKELALHDNIIKSKSPYNDIGIFNNFVITEMSNYNDVHVDNNMKLTRLKKNDIKKRKSAEDSSSNQDVNDDIDDDDNDDNDEGRGKDDNKVTKKIKISKNDESTNKADVKLNEKDNNKTVESNSPNAVKSIEKESFKTVESNSPNAVKSIEKESFKSIEISKYTPSIVKSNDKHNVFIDIEGEVDKENKDDDKSDTDSVYSCTLPTTDEELQLRISDFKVITDIPNFTENVKSNVVNIINKIKKINKAEDILEDLIGNFIIYYLNQSYDNSFHKYKYVYLWICNCREVLLTLINDVVDQYVRDVLTRKQATNKRFEYIRRFDFYFQLILYLIYNKCLVEKRYQNNYQPVTYKPRNPFVKQPTVTEFINKIFQAITKHDFNIIIITLNKKKIKTGRLNLKDFSNSILEYTRKYIQSFNEYKKRRNSKPKRDDVEIPSYNRGTSKPKKKQKISNDLKGFIVPDDQDDSSSSSSDDDQNDNKDDSKFVNDNNVIEPIKIKKNVNEPIKVTKKLNKHIDDLDENTNTNKSEKSLEDIDVILNNYQKKIEYYQNIKNKLTNVDVENLPITTEVSSVNNNSDTSDSVVDLLNHNQQLDISSNINYDNFADVLNLECNYNITYSKFRLIGANKNMSFILHGEIENIGGIDETYQLLATDKQYRTVTDYYNVILNKVSEMKLQFQLKYENSLKYKTIGDGICGLRVIYQIENCLLHNNPSCANIEYEDVILNSEIKFNEFIAWLDKRCTRYQYIITKINEYNNSMTTSNDFDNIYRTYLLENEDNIEFLNYLESNDLTYDKLKEIKFVDIQVLVEWHIKFISYLSDEFKTFNELNVKLNEGGTWLPKEYWIEYTSLPLLLNFKSTIEVVITHSNVNSELYRQYAENIYELNKVCKICYEDYIIKDDVKYTYLLKQNGTCYSDISKIFSNDNHHIIVLDADHYFRIPKCAVDDVKEAFDELFHKHFTYFMIKYKSSLVDNIYVTKYISTISLYYKELAIQFSQKITEMKNINKSKKKLSITTDINNDNDEIVIITTPSNKSITSKRTPPSTETIKGFEFPEMLDKKIILLDEDLKDTSIKTISCYPKFKFKNLDPYGLKDNYAKTIKSYTKDFNIDADDNEILSTYSVYMSAYQDSDVVTVLGYDITKKDLLNLIDVNLWKNDSLDCWLNGKVIEVMIYAIIFRIKCIIDRNLYNHKSYISKTVLVDVFKTDKQLIMKFIKSAIPKEKLNERKYERIYIIYNIYQSHYILLEFDNKENDLYIYDSLNNDNSVLAQKLIDLVFEIHRVTYIYKNNLRKEICKQVNTCDCGVFVLLYLYYLTMGIAPTNKVIDVKQMIYYRKKIFATVLKGKLPL